MAGTQIQYQNKVAVWVIAGRGGAIADEYEA